MPDNDALIVTITAASKTLARVTEIYSYDLDDPIALPAWPGRLFTRITVKITRFPGSAEPGMIKVIGYHRQRTATGIRRQLTAGKPTVLPAELAAPLVLRALTA
jgi:hypothetical protein